MPTSKEQLVEIEKEIGYYENLLEHYKKLKRFKLFSNFVRLFFSCVVVGSVVFILGLVLSKKDFTLWNDWFSILCFTLYPGIFFIEPIYKGLEKLAEWLSFKLAKIDKNEYINTNIKLNDTLKRKKSIEQQIRHEEILAQKEIEKEYEFNFLNKILAAVAKIEKRQISFEAARELQVELENDIRYIKSFSSYYYHKNIFYQNRLDKISEALNDYSSPQKQNPSRSPLESRKNGGVLNGLKTVEKSINEGEENNNSTEQKDDKPIDKSHDRIEVKPFSPSYVPVINYQLPLHSSDKINDDAEIAEPLSDSSNVEFQVQDEPFKKEISLDDLLKQRINKTQVISSKKEDKQPVKIDYSSLNDTKLTTGVLGETYALEWEKNRLMKSGLGNYVDDVKHVSLMDDSLGYDILSFNEDGSERYIEVKTTTAKFHAPFYLSETEREAMYKMFNYFIYRIFNFDAALKKGDITMINCDKNIDKNFAITPVSYKVSIK